MKKLLLAVPKGRILEELNPMLTRINIIPEADFFDESSRKLVFQTNSANLEIVKVRSFDVATFVKFGAADAGICGLDVLQEFSSPEIFSVLDLEIGKCRLSIAAKQNSSQNLQGFFQKDLAKKSHIRIATKYTSLTRNYFSALGISYWQCTYSNSN
jgi:ATP phosphoribosyltransferase